MSLSGAKLAGSNPKNHRIENDFYATDPKAVKMILNSGAFDFYRNPSIKILEPCVGEGHIIKEVIDYYKEKNNIEYTTLDIVDRGFSDTIVCDFLNWKFDKKYDLIITNPPYSLATEFVEKSIGGLSNKGYLAMFLKIQFLEGKKREELFKKYPPKYIYVFRNRMATWNNGQPKDPETGKKWATTMCHAWFIWQKDSTTEPIVRWL